MAKETKQFLDLTGLLRLWDKMKSTFADKSVTEYNIRNINDEISDINASIEVLDNNIVLTNTEITSNTPKEADTYSEALELAKDLKPGVIIKVNRSEKTENNAVFVAGFYIIENTIPASIRYIGTTSGSSEDDEVLKLKNKVSKIESSFIANAKYADDNNEYSYDVSNNTLVIKYDNEYVANSESVNALTHRAIAVKFGELESMISSIPKFKISIVDSLPTNDISPTTIYLVRNYKQGTNNLFTEYIYIEKSSNIWVWEKLGEQSIELSDYISRSEVESLINAAISQTITKAEFEKVINTTKAELTSTIDNKISDVAKDFVKHDELDDLLIESITVGGVGNEIRIPPEQIKELIF